MTTSATDATVALGTGPNAIPTVILESGGGDESTAFLGQKVLAGRYRIDGLLGTGGMGHVYRAFDVELAEVVALKVLRRDLGQAPRVVERFRQEVRLARRVTHRQVARTYDIGTDGDDTFITMELIDGVPLSVLIATEGAFSEARALAIVREVAEGLAAAHEVGVVHRDLKPDNVLVSRDGRIVVTDFGVARQTGGSSGQTAGILGTPRYMAPEQAEGADDVDARADVYALGELLFELLTGKPPWPDRETGAMLVTRVVDPSPELPSAVVVTPAVRDLVGQAMARERDGRPADARRFLEALVSANAVPRPESFAARSDVAPSAGGPVRIAVLPIVNRGAEDDAYLAEGFTEELVDALSLVQRLRVRPLASAMKLTGRDPIEAGGILGVDVIVDGSLRRTPGGARITLRLSSVQDGFQVWASRTERPFGELLVGSENAAREIAAALSSRYPEATRHTRRDELVEELYLRGRQAMRRAWYGEVTLDGALELLDAALERAPGDPRIRAALAIARARSGSGGAKALAEQAIAMAPDNNEAWIALLTVAEHSGDPAELAQVLDRARREAPRMAGFVDREARFLAEVGPLDAAIARFADALSLAEGAWKTRCYAARAHLLAGDVATARLLLTGDAIGHQDAPLVLGMRARLALWCGESFRVPECPEPRSVPALFVRAVVRLRAGDEPGALSDVAAIERAVTVLPARVRPFVWQLAAELLGALSRPEEALVRVAAAEAASLFDLVWLERCPVLADVRAEPGFAPIHARVSARAALLREALCGQTLSGSTIIL